jgi:hypothetical protein
MATVVSRQALRPLPAKYPNVAVHPAGHKHRNHVEQRASASGKLHRLRSA